MFEKVFKRVLAGGVVATGIAVSGYWLVNSQAQPPRASPPVASRPAAISTPTVQTFYEMILQNGYRLRVYPENPVKPFETLNWYALVPVVCRGLRHDAENRQVLATLDHFWQKDEERELRTRLAAGYKEAGRPVDADAINIVKLQPMRHKLLLRFGNTELPVQSVSDEAGMTSQTIVARLPMTWAWDQATALLKTNPEVVQIVLRASYRSNQLAGLTVENTTLTSAWQKVKEKIAPNKATTADWWLVDRNVEQNLRKMIAASTSTTVKSFGLLPKDEAEYLARATAALQKPLPALSAQELLALEKKALYWTGDKLETVPATSREDIHSLTEIRNLETLVETLTEALHDVASNSSLDERRFHEEARKLVLKSDARVKVMAIFNGGHNLHLDRETKNLEDTHLKSVNAARQLLQNKD